MSDPRNVAHKKKVTQEKHHQEAKPAANIRQTIAIILILFASLAPLTATAQEQPPLQADVRVRVKNKPAATASFQRFLEGGSATVRGSVHNLPGGDTALVLLRFDYRTDADIAFDEIISQIVISVEDVAGNQFSSVIIDPNTINLNPNRVPLFYSATLYKPERTGGRSGYIAHVQVFGNYE
jgi:hypothetical protein